MFRWPIPPGLTHASTRAAFTDNNAQLLTKIGFHFVSTPGLFARAWGRQSVYTELVHIWTGVICDANKFRKRAMQFDQLGFHILSTPTLPNEGWGRQNVETVLSAVMCVRAATLIVAAPPCRSRLDWYSSPGQPAVLQLKNILSNFLVHI